MPCLLDTGLKAIEELRCQKKGFSRESRFHFVTVLPFPHKISISKAGDAMVQCKNSCYEFQDAQ